MADNGSFELVRWLAAEYRADRDKAGEALSPEAAEQVDRFADFCSRHLGANLPVATSYLSAGFGLLMPDRRVLAFSASQGAGAPGVVPTGVPITHGLQNHPGLDNRYR